MKILFLTENFPPETNAAASRVHERACYWVRWGHAVTVITCAPNFPEGRLFPGYANRWRQTGAMDGIRIVRVKTYIAPNRGVVRRTLDFMSFMVSGFTAALLEEKPDVIAATSPQFFAAVAGWMAGARAACLLCSSLAICGRLRSLPLAPCGQTWGFAWSRRSSFFSTAARRQSRP
jgi:hypothetical protein